MRRDCLKIDKNFCLKNKVIYVVIIIFLPKSVSGLPEKSFSLNISLASSESKTITEGVFPIQNVTTDPYLSLSLANSRAKCSLVPRKAIIVKMIFIHLLDILFLILIYIIC